MMAGPTIQFSTRETPNCSQAWAIFPSSSYFTPARTGYIIHSRPMAMGSDTVSTRNVSNTPAPPFARPWLAEPARNAYPRARSS